VPTDLIHSFGADVERFELLVHEAKPGVVRAAAAGADAALLRRHPDGRRHRLGLGVHLVLGEARLGWERRPYGQTVDTINV
jgi:hypothetical protein